MWRRRAAAFVIVALAIGLAAGLYRHYYPLPPKLTLKPLHYDALDGWMDDSIAAAVPAFVKSCAKVTARGDGEAFAPVVKSGDFGTVGDWRPVCAAAAQLPASDVAARGFFEREFMPLLAGNRGNSDGLFTGYYEIVLDGSLRRDGKYQTPIYRRPADPKAYTRAQIDGGALAGQRLELLWVDDPIGAYFLQIQGSGIVRLADGKSIRLGYDGSNGKPFVSIGRLLVQRSEVPLKDMTMPRLRDWIAAHGEAGKALMREDPSFVFFNEVAGTTGPYGSERVVLTAQRSLAVDRRFIPLGMPLWLDATQRFTAGTVRKLVVAQDTGGAIKGPVRGDFYWGSGDEAGRQAGAMNASGRYALLVPRAVAQRTMQSAGGAGGD
ncbi:MAG TPA: MltA domain-containing protein [Stellaceae bacterium]|jgi:membrane-bound lytic murein transglycosylase A|nr:MltA domain-containing protein [Stellaceae bacterium]